MNNGMKTLIMAAAVALAPMFVAVASPAGAYPCRQGDADFSSFGCASCVHAAGGSAGPTCLGANVPTNQAPANFPDCNQYVLPSDRAKCGDEHIAGQR